MTARKTKTQHISLFLLCIASKASGDAFEGLAVNLSIFESMYVFIKSCDIIFKLL